MQKQEMDLNPEVIFNDWRLETIEITVKRETHKITAYTNGNIKYALQYDPMYSETNGGAYFDVVYLCDVQSIVGGVVGGKVNSPDCIGEDDRSVICAGVITKDSVITGDSFVSTTDGLKIVRSNISDSTISADSGSIVGSTIVHSILYGTLSIQASTLSDVSVQSESSLAIESSKLLKVRGDEIQIWIKLSNIVAIRLASQQFAHDQCSSSVNKISNVSLSGMELNQLPTLLVDVDINAETYEELILNGSMTSDEVNNILRSRVATKYSPKESSYTGVANNILSEGDKCE